MINTNSLSNESTYTARCYNANGRSMPDESRAKIYRMGLIGNDFVNFMRRAFRENSNGNL